jgi:cyclophilin family peptidyl-prolyl cis-trans isomerase
MNWKKSSMLLAASGLVFGLAGCGGDQSAGTTGGAPTNVPAEMAGNTPAETTGNAPAEATGNAPAETPAEGGAKPAASGDAVKVVMETSKGTIELELNPKKAPITVENFLGYVKKGHYNGTVFHRVIPGFMVQGGGFTPDLKEKDTGKGIKNESDNGLTNDRGTIAMARTQDPDSATAQFFISVNDNKSLNYPNAMGSGYAVFGKVTKGMDVVDKIVSVPTTSKPLNGMMPADDVPVETVLLKSAKVVK